MTQRVMVSEAKPKPAVDAPTSDGEITVAAKIIKRYSNRKLYDTDRSKYVTLEEISEMIKAGEHVQIIDNKSKADLTSATLAQIIFESEKRQSKMPLSMLRNLIQTSGDALGDFFDKSVKAPVETAAHSAQKTAEEIMTGAQQIRDAATRGVDDLADTARRVFGRGKDDAADAKVEEIARRFDGAFEEITRRIEATTREAPHNGPDVVVPVIERLSERLDEVKTKLGELHRASLTTVTQLPDKTDESTEA